MAVGIRKTARWGKDIPLEPETQEKLIKKLAEVYGPTKVRRAVLVCPVAVENVIDNENDAQRTLTNLEQKGKVMNK